MSLGNTVTVVKNENLVIVSTPGPKGDKGDTGTNGAGGDVVGPSSAVSGNLPMFSDTTGKRISDSGTSVSYLTNLILNREVTGVAATLVSNHAALQTGIHGINITAGKTLSASNTLTLAGNDGSTLSIGAGGTLAALAFSAAAPAGTLTGTTLASGVTASSLTSFGANPVIGVASATSLSSGAGSKAAPSINLGDANTGIYKAGSEQLGFSMGGSSGLRLINGYIAMHSGYALCWTSGDAEAGADTLIHRGGAGILQQRNGVNPQESQIFGTFSDTSNYRHLSLEMTTGGVATIAAKGLGSGVASNELVFGVNLITPWKIDANGHLLAVTDNGYDIGEPANKRPRRINAANILFAGHYNYVGPGGLFGFSDGVSVARGYLGAPSNGVFTLMDNTLAEFNRLQYGGTTSSFPCEKRRGATLETRLADDSAIAVHVHAYITKAGAISDSDFTNPVDGCHGYDTTNNKHYVRNGGVWKSSAAYT